MVTFRAWEIKNGRATEPTTFRKIFPEIYFRHTEKIMLYWSKNIIHWVILYIVKYWFIISTKTKKWFDKKLPQIRIFFKRLSRDGGKIREIFAHRSVIELRTKIKHMREKVRRENGVEH